MVRSVYAGPTPGLVVLVGGRRRRITHLVGRDAFLAEDIDGGRPGRHRNGEVEGIPEAEQAIPAPAVPDLATIPEASMAEARRRFAIIEPLLNMPARSRPAVEEAAKSAGIHAGTAYAWIAAYERSNSLMSLIPSKRGRKPGSKFIDPRAEAIVTANIQELYLNAQQRVPGPVIAAVKKEAKKAGLPVPHGNTVRRRIDILDPQDTMRRRGNRRGADRLRPVPGNYPATLYPMQVIQIDHTPADLIGLDDLDRMPLGRPWITLAIDVFSRLVVGIVVGWERPNSATVGLCISQIILPKGPVLAALGLDGEWPACGKPGMILIDNAKEFDSDALKRACEANGIAHEFRPVATPQAGGHIERLMLTTAQELRNVPGATFANVREKGEYDSEKQAVMTLDEIERYLFSFYVNTYNVRPHAGLGGLTPLAKFNAGMAGDDDSIGTGAPEIPRDHARLHIDFLPPEERNVLRQGVVIDHVWYWDEVLAPLIGLPPSVRSLPSGKYVFRRDPRKISPIHFWDAKLERHVPIHYANKSLPVISLWQLRAARKQLHAEGAKHVDEDGLMKAHEQRMRMIEDADAATRARRKDIRREIQRKQATERAVAQQPGDVPNQRAPEGPRPNAADPIGDIFDEPVAMPEVELNPKRR